MRALLLTFVAASVLAGCASAPVNTASTTYDHKYNMIAQTKPAPDFVGTSATVNTTKPQPSWYRFGHP